MIRQTDLDHHLRRQGQHRDQAAATDDKGARKAHLEMAAGHARHAATAKKAMDRRDVMTNAEFEASLKPPPSTATDAERPANKRAHTRNSANDHNPRDAGSPA